ncbi:MAG: hypothetical protein JXX28_07560 [Deltaproteobacteria bacterium]|nr:hypothetical protein [Deltaproteobacteria bacterium]
MLYRFTEIDPQGPLAEQVGRKGQALVQLQRWGLPVPDGACLLTGALDAFLAHNGLSREQAPSELIAGLREGEMPPAVSAALAAFLEGREEVAWAVRSSGTREDGADASFAGLYASVLHLRGQAQVEGGIRAAWASLFGERVRAYAVARGIPPHALGLAVVLQELVDAEQAGVAFTVNPLTGADREVVIEAVRGLGEALVGGLVTPDRYRYDWWREHLLSRELGSATQAVRPVQEPPYTELIDLPGADRGAQVLSAEQVAEVAQLAVRVQALYGFPVDVEWAMRGGEVLLLQSRPITTIGQGAVEGEWTTADFKDGGVSSTVCSPLMWSLYDLVWEDSMPRYLEGVHLIAPRQGVVWGDMFYGRPYWNLSAVKDGVRRLPGFRERSFDEDLGIAVAYEGDGHVTKTTPRTLWTALKVVTALRASFKRRLAGVEALVKGWDARLVELDQVDLTAMDLATLTGWYDRLIREVYFRAESDYFNHIYDSTNFASLIKDRLAGLTPSPNTPALISGLTNLSHLRLNQDLWELSRVLYADHRAFSWWRDTPIAALREAVEGEREDHQLGRVRALLRAHGHHSTRELDLTVPRYREDPTFLLETLRELALQDAPREPRAVSEGQRAGYLAERARLLAATPLSARGTLARELDQWRELLWWREELRDLSTRMYAQVRRATCEVAGRLVEGGVLADRADAFFLTWQELVEVLRGLLPPAVAAERVARARVYYDSYRNYANPDELGQRFAKAKIPEGDVLKGVGCSGGQVTGTARVIRDIFDADRLQPGDVLITRFTDPGWTPKFALIAGVATETGGLLSHAAVISREYGIPAVLAIPGLTGRVRDGQRVTLDGDRGLVVLEDAGA